MIRISQYDNKGKFDGEEGNMDPNTREYLLKYYRSIKLDQMIEYAKNGILDEATFLEIMEKPYKPRDYLNGRLWAWMDHRNPGTLKSLIQKLQPNGFLLSSLWDAYYSLFPEKIIENMDEIKRWSRILKDNAETLFDEYGEDLPLAAWTELISNTFHTEGFKEILARNAHKLDYAEWYHLLTKDVEARGHSNKVLELIPEKTWHLLALDAVEEKKNNIKEREMATDDRKREFIDDRMRRFDDKWSSRYNQYKNEMHSLTRDLVRDELNTWKIKDED